MFGGADSKKCLNYAQMHLNKLPISYVHSSLFRMAESWKEAVVIPILKKVILKTRLIIYKVHFILIYTECYTFN